MSYCTIFVDHKIKTTVIWLTQGGRGGDRRKRGAEFEAAMKWWGFDYEILNFPDLELVFTDLRVMVERVMGLVEDRRLTTLVSFDPREVTYGFDHPDHNRTGEVTRVVSTMMGGTRGLWFWRSRGRASLVDERVEYARRFYRSQKIPRAVLKQIGESYLKVR